MDGAIVGTQAGEIQTRVPEIRMAGTQVQVQVRVRVRVEEREVVGGDKVRLRVLEGGAQARTRVTTNGLEVHHHLGQMLLGRAPVLAVAHGRCFECCCFRVLYLSVYDAILS